MPIPVTTTRRMMTCLQLDNVRRCEPINSSGLRLDEVDGILHREDLLGGVVGDLAAELFFESHDQLDGIKAVRAQIVDEAGAFGDLRLFDAEMLDDDLLDPFRDVAHFKSLSAAPPYALCRRKILSYWPVARPRNRP